MPKFIRLPRVFILFSLICAIPTTGFYAQCPVGLTDNLVELSEIDGTNGITFNGIDVNDFSGISVSGAGDINGDGLDDILIGASSADLPSLGLQNNGET